jgi:hypothetical protein
VVSPSGRPVATKIYAFEVGARVNPAYAYFGRGTPPEVQVLARRLSRGRGNLVAEVNSDETGAFRFAGEGLGGFEVLLVAAAAEGVGALPARPPLQDLVLALEPRRSLQVQVVSQEDLSQARLELDLGPAGGLEFPPLDPRGATTLEVPALLPGEVRLRLQRPGWLPLARYPAATELAGGRLVWTLPTNLADLRGKVQDAAGANWVGGKVQFMFRDEEGEGWRHLQVSTDAEGAFLGRGFPPGQRVWVRVQGTAKHAYHREQVTAGGPPLLIQLQATSLLRIRVERFEGDVDAIEAEWKLERREGEAWEEVDWFLRGRIPRRFPAQEGELERRFGLRIGRNEVLGLPAGRYRVSLRDFDDNKAESVEVELRPGAAATCRLGVQQRPPTTFRIQLVSPGRDLGGKRARVSYTNGEAEVLRTPVLDAEGVISFQVRFEEPLEAEISVPDLGLGAKVTLDPKRPDLGALSLERD